LGTELGASTIVPLLELSQGNHETIEIICDLAEILIKDRKYQCWSLLCSMYSTYFTFTAWEISRMNEKRIWACVRI